RASSGTRAARTPSRAGCRAFRAGARGLGTCCPIGNREGFSHKEKSPAAPVRRTRDSGSAAAPAGGAAFAASANAYGRLPVGNGQAAAGLSGFAAGAGAAFLAAAGFLAAFFLDAFLAAGFLAAFFAPLLAAFFSAFFAPFFSALFSAASAAGVLDGRLGGRLLGGLLRGGLLRCRFLRSFLGGCHEDLLCSGCCDDGNPCPAARGHLPVRAIHRRKNIVQACCRSYANEFGAK